MYSIPGLVDTLDVLVFGTYVQDGPQKIDRNRALIGGSSTPLSSPKVGSGATSSYTVLKMSPDELDAGQKHIHIW